MSLLYITGGKKKRFFRIKKNKNKKTGEVSGEVTRISCKEYDDSKTNTMLGKIKPNVGDKVVIIVKPYHTYTCHTGIVKNVLTNRQIHTRGHKVRLDNGVI